MNDWTQYLPEKFPMRGRWVDNWFSNLVPDTVRIGGVNYPSVENYYQGMKSIVGVPPEFEFCTPAEAKRLGRKLPLREDWEEVKETIMMVALKHKFTKSPWKERLLDTGDEVIVEWNNWNDKYWGADWKSGEGKNRLGILLMELRDLLRNEEDNK